MDSILEVTNEPIIPSPFRIYCTNKWYEHKDELFNWEGHLPDYEASYYFKKNRWLLKKMYNDSKSG
tara:strand:- start:110 stop:307 length:198 start_codon:yes stop_codon:yes gene_type:complete